MNEVAEKVCACGGGEGRCGMTHPKPEEVRDLLRAVTQAGTSRDIVAAGFVRAVAVDGATVMVEFAPDARDAAKVADMERGIRNVLYGANFIDVQIKTVRPFGDETMQLGGATMNPLQFELMEDGIAPQPDVLRDALQRPDMAPGAGYRAEGPDAFEGPRGPKSMTYDGAMPVLQWDIDPHDATAQSRETEVKIDGWDYRVWWQVHPCGDLLFASLQAMRDDWADHIGKARLHPVGRSEAVNLVYDVTRRAVIAIYGTVRDFCPFVEVFSQAYAKEAGTPAHPESGKDTP